MLREVQPSSSGVVQRGDKTSSPKPPPPEPDDGLRLGEAAREDDELEREIKKHIPRARENVIAIHGGTEEPVTIEGHEVGVGIEIKAFKRLCREAWDPPDIIAAAIAHIPVVSDLQPPVSLARWGAADGMPIYEQCVGRAYKGMAPTIDAPAKTMPVSSGDVGRVEKRKAELREQVEQIQREASP